MKKYWLNLEKNKWESQYYSFGELEIFKDWPDNEKSWNNWPEEYQPLIETVKKDLGKATATNPAKEMLRALVKSELPTLVEIKFDWIPDPGGGGGWKSNANSIIPKFIMVKAVYDVTTESKSKERQSLTTYGEILNLVLEKRLMLKPEIKELKTALAKVQALFRPDPDHADWEIAEEITEFETKLSALLSKVIESKAKLILSEIPVQDILLPNTRLRLDDGYETEIQGQGHGLQRTLIMSLLQMLIDYENIPNPDSEQDKDNIGIKEFMRTAIFAIEEPELYMHPQMQRKVRYTLYDLAASDNYQVICSTHSPVFLDMAEKHTAIVRLEIREEREIVKKQVAQEIFSGDDRADKKKKLRMITEFDPAVNELFFAKRVVLVEGDTEVAIFQRTAELMGIFEAYPHKRRDTTFINCHGKETIPLFLEVLNHFEVKYVVFHDEDQGKEQAMRANDAIDVLVCSPNRRHMFSPNDLESVLGYDTSTKDKPIKALEKIEELAESNLIPDIFQEHVKIAWGLDS